MTTEPRNPREHCRNAERALAALDVDDANTLAVTALVSASSRRCRRVAHLAAPRTVAGTYTA
jgi:hypothetical protein